MIVRRSQALLPLSLPPEGLSLDCTGAPVELELNKGKYVFELWGSQGGNENITVGRGAYCKGTLELTEKRTLYVYVGQRGGVMGEDTGGWNGGHINNNAWYQRPAGGGATDIRLVLAEWSDLVSLRSRIMVAAAGAGGTNFGLCYAGALVSQPWMYTQATQTQGSGFGYKPRNVPTDLMDPYGPGAGYYAGASGYVGDGNNNAQSAGGTSFISGHPGCDAIRDQESTVHTGQPNHYSGLVFKDTLMIDGKTSMPNPRGAGNVTGNPGNGFARIKQVR